MVARIFHEHGWFIGAHPTSQGYPTYENIEVKAWLRNTFSPLRRGRFVDAGPHRDRLAEIVAEWPQPWAWKGGIEFKPLWDQFAPITIGVRRSTRGVVKSLVAKTGADPAEAEALVRRRHALLDAHCDYPIYTEEVVRGRFNSLRVAMQAAGGTFCPAIAGRVVEPTRWHHK
jgi:hypothetical protein